MDVDPSLQVQADPECLIRSFANILRNAVRYAGDKGPIRIAAQAENHRIKISVADSGPRGSRGRAGEDLFPFIDWKTRVTAEPAEPVSGSRL